MAKRAWKSIVRRKNKVVSDFGGLGALTATLEEDEASVVLRARSPRPAGEAGHSSEGTKRFTINLGVEDLPAVPRPESVARYRTDDEMGVRTRRKSSLRIGSASGDEDDFTPFLLREYLRKEDAERYGGGGGVQQRKSDMCWLDKETKLRERKNSLIVLRDEDLRSPSRSHETGHRRCLMQQKRDAMCLPLTHENEATKENVSPGQNQSTFYVDQVFDDVDNANVLARPTATSGTRLSNVRQDVNLSLATQVLIADGGVEGAASSLADGLPPVPPPRRKRDARRRVGVFGSDSSTPSTPGTPQSLTSSSPGTPQSLAASHSLVTSTPGTPQSFQISTVTLRDREVPSPDTPLTPGTPLTPDSASSTMSFLLPPPDHMAGVTERSKKALTLDNRVKRKSQEEEGSAQVYKQRSTEDLSQARCRRDLRRSISDYGDIALKDLTAGNKARRTNSDADGKREDKHSLSFRDRLFRGSTKEKTTRSLPSRTFQRIKSVRKPSPPVAKSGHGSDCDEGVVAGVQNVGRGSAPSSPQLVASRSAESTPSKFNFFSKLKGKAAAGVKPSAKTTSKADKQSKNGESTIDNSDGSLPLGRSHSHDNIQSPAYPPDHDALCSPLHDRNQQNQDDTRRTENTLKIWIMEAKGIPNKKKYFCILKLNSSLYGRTCSKQKSNMCFWGEYFELDLLPQVSTICIELMREADKKSVRKKIGTVEIDLKTSSSNRAALEEQWYPVKVDKQDRDVPALRIKHRFQSVDILPLPQYAPLRQYLKENATSLCQLLEPVVSVKAKEDIATTLVNIMQAENRAIPFLVNLVFTDIQRMAENEHLLFRGNSVATKAIEAYMKLVGEQYLHGTLREPVQALITASEDLEVDPLRITNIQSLHSQRNALKEHVSAVWEKILQSGRNFPVELRHVFHTLRERLSRQEKCELIDYLISSCVFLRFLCPAVLSPSLFNIIKEYPDERAGRNLTLVAKILQTLANFTHFQGKENFMEFLNDFINKEQERCRTFLRTISSSLNEEDSTLEFDGKIDLGKHLALLHLHLADALAKLNTQGCESEASKVLALVDDISTLLGRDYSGAPIVSQPVSTHTLVCTPPLVSNPSLLTTPSHINNNYTREDCVDGLVESPMSMGLVGGGGAGLVIPTTTTLRSQSLPRAVTPIYSQHQMASGSPGANFAYRDKTAANDLSTNDEYVLITAFDHRTEPQNYMYPSVEANNNNAAPMTDVRLSNGNTYFMAEVAPPGSPLRQGGSPGPHHPEIVQQSLRGHLHTPHQSRLHPRATTMSSRSHSVSGVPNPIERRGLYQDECSELYSYMDSCSHQIHALCMDSENNIQGSQTSISQLSNIASSGYQSFAYSQSSSPVDSLLHTDNASLLSRENGNPGPPGFRQVLHGSPLASPLHQPVASKHRAVPAHPAQLGHTGHVSLHGTPRHIPRVPQPKGSPNSSLSSSQSVEDLSSLRRGRTRQRRSASSSSDSSPDTRPASHTHAHSRRPHAHPPRTNPHCSPHLVPSPALRQEHRSRSRHDRSVSGRRGRNYRSCDREDFPRGTTHCYEDSEDDVSVVTRSSGGAGVGSWMKDGRHVSQDEYQPPHKIAPQQLLDQQEDQMRAIVERLMSMEHEFRHEQEVMRREMHDKDARIDAQAKKIAALDTANTHLIRTIASLSSRSGEMKNELPGDINIDSCNASDTSDYKSSSC